MLPLGLLLFVVPGPAPLDPVTVALEKALLQQPSHVLRLALAERAAFLGDCAGATHRYREFFSACAHCELRELGLRSLDRQTHCYQGLESELAWRAPLDLPDPRPPAPAPSTIAEVRRLALALGWPIGGYEPHPGLGWGPISPAFPAEDLERRRARAWSVLREVPISPQEIERLLEVVPHLEPTWLAWLRGELTRSPDNTRLELLRTEVLLRYADGEPLEVCRVGRAERAYLTLAIQPEVEVYLDGALIGTTPLARIGMPADSGRLILHDPRTHEVRALAPALDRSRTSIFSTKLEALELIDAPLDEVLAADRARAESRDLDLARACLRVDAERALVGGHHDEARALLQSCVRARAEAWDCWRTLAVVEERVGRLSEACAAINRYLELRPWAGDRGWAEALEGKSCPGGKALRR